MKRIISFILVCVMILPMCIFQVSAETPELTNWNTMAAKYSTSTHSIIAPKSNGYVIKTEGFTFTEQDDDGISVVTPDYNTFPGAYGVSAVTSKATTPLDSLTVVIEPDEFDFAIDSAKSSNTVSVLWTEDPITELAGFDETTNAYTTGLSDAVKVGTNGLRHIIPTHGSETGVPAYIAEAAGKTTDGKALCINVTNHFDEYSETKNASVVTITYYDGYYINSEDGRPGYRWTFSARNFTSQYPNADCSGIVSKFHEIDLTYGLVVKVRADETHGYIVNINGTDYYKGKRVAGDTAETPIIAYYPDANVDGTGMTTMLKDEDYANKTAAYLNSMTYAKADIDLSGLKDVEEGYVTVGAVSINDRYFPDHHCNYTLSSVNTVPAAEWKGETFPKDHVCEYTDEEVPATCTEDGAIVHRCGCGSVYSTRIAALGHDMILDETKSYEPTCTTKGREIKDCSRCDNHTDVWVNALGHDLDDWYVAEVATPDALGTKAQNCTRCDYVNTKSYAYSGLDDVIEDWEITATNGISILDPEMPIVDAEVNDDGSILVKDYSLMTGFNASHSTVTKAINKHKTSLNGFTATVTPVAFNENFPDQYPESLSFTLTNAYDKYNYATEYSAGWLTKNLPEYYAGVPSNEVYRYGNIWGYPYSTDMLKEYTVSFTLMDYMSLNGKPIGTDNDGYYDIVFWSVRSGGNHWIDKYVRLDSPIKMGKTIELCVFYEKDPTTGNTGLIAGFNPDWDNWGNIFDMSIVQNSQSPDAIYNFIVAAHSPTIVNPDNSMESLSASSFVINSICGESAVDFDGYYMSPEIDEMAGEYIPLETPHTHEDVTNNKWVIINEGSCVDPKVEAKCCTLCGEPVEVVNSPSSGHSFTNYIYNDDATCTDDGTKTASCDYGCGTTDTVTAEGTAAHKYTEDILQAPTCTETGYALYICDCGDYYIEELVAVEHIYTEYTYNNDATCTADGTKTASCDYGCGTENTITAEGSVIPHVYTDYTYNDDATCTADGTMTAYCDYGCGNSDTLIATGTKGEHNYKGEVTLEATCTTVGTMLYTCIGCGETYVEEIPKTPHNYATDVIKEATCKATGLVLYMCSCRSYYTGILPMIDHTWGEWQITKLPTASSSGEETRTCSVCFTTQTREIVELPAPVIAVDNYTVTINQADLIKDMRYALGTYTTTAEIRAAEGNVALSNALVVKYTTDGVFTYEMPNGGYYTVWIRMTDGRNYILPLDVTTFTPSVTSDGVRITLHDLYNVKDFYIAKGEYTTYREIKDNGYIFNATAAKIGAKHDYTYTVYEPGVHTILIRYNDGTQALFHETLTVDEPVFTTNGLQVTVTNIPDVKVIRTAYGEWNTITELKATDTIRNFSNKTTIKDAESYKIQYRDEGMVTIIVEYNNGYQKVFHYDVQKKEPTIKQDGNSVTFGNLDGLVMIRYAKGEYTTATEIKKAPGSKVIKPDAIVDGYITVSDLEDETYTFCVQYDDESYYYCIFDPTEPTAVGVSVSSAFTDNMILQRDEKCSVWGWADESQNGKTVKVEIDGKVAMAEVVDGEWKAEFENTFPANTEGTSVYVHSADETIEFKNVLFGDVYYIIGQSNVHYSLVEMKVDSILNRFENQLVFDFDDSRNIRFFRNSNTYHMTNTGDRAQGTVTLYKDAEVPKGWQTPSDVKMDYDLNYPSDINYFNRSQVSTEVFSALGYLFAYNMSEVTDVPIGVIEIDASGFPLISFAPNELAEKWGTEAYNEETGQYFYYLKGINMEGYSGDLASDIMHTRFAYNQQLYPLINFSTAGILWYQGESDWANTRETLLDTSKGTFQTQFAELMTYYRQHMGNDDFPVYIVEFPTCFANPYNPSHAYIPTGAVRTELGTIPQILDNSYVVASSDFFYNNNWANNIHPYIKHLQAERLANMALSVGYNVDGYDINYTSGPVLRNVNYIDEHNVELKFNYVADGLTVCDESGEGLICGLEILVDGKWIEYLYAEITDKDTVVINYAGGEVCGVRYNRKTDAMFVVDITLGNYNSITNTIIPATAFVDYK